MQSSQSYTFINFADLLEANRNLSTATSETSFTASDLPSPQLTVAQIESSSSKKCNKSPSPPLMGKSALLKKYNHCTDDRSCAEIVSDIVTEKFNSILAKRRGRNSMRSRVHANVEKDKDIDTKSTNIDDDSLKLTTIWEDEERLLSENKQSKLQRKDSAVNENCDETLSVYEPLYDEVANDAPADLCYENIAVDNYNESSVTSQQIRYEARKFIERAFQDESSALNKLNIFHNNEIAPLPLRCRTDASSSVDTSQISSLYKANLHILDMFCGTKSGHSVETISSPFSSNEELFADIPPLDPKSRTLIRDAAMQNQIILQTSKALNLCEASKKLTFSMEYIEAEKILLLASLKYDAMKKEISTPCYEYLGELGRVTVSNLLFPMTVELPHSSDVTQWCIAVVSCGSTVWATETIQSVGRNIQFDQSITFENLEDDFEITISLYTLYVKNNSRTGAENLNCRKKKKTTKCPSPKKFLNCSSSKLNYGYEKRQSSFFLCGTCTIRLADIKTNYEFKLTRIPNTSLLKGIVVADICATVDFPEPYSGFLTIGSEVAEYATWNRRWCRLKGYELQYWNYPSEEEIMEPIRSIDLRFCVASQINQVDRELCARPRTLLLEIIRLSSKRGQKSVNTYCKSSYVITRYYLSADNYQDMKNWQYQLNTVLGALKNWNYMKCQLHVLR